MSVCNAWAFYIASDTISDKALLRSKIANLRNTIIIIEQEIEDRIITQHGHVLEQEWFGLKPTFAVSSGGLHPGLVDKLIKKLGNNIIIQAGGGIHGHPNGTRDGATAMRQAVDAMMNKKSLKEYAKTHYELRLALHKWGQ